MTSPLFQLRMSDRDIRLFQSPSSQASNPYNCGAVTGQLLGLVTPGTANEMTILQQGMFIKEWALYVSDSLQSPVTRHEESILRFERFSTYNLFPGFATLVLSFPDGNGMGHYFVVGKTQDNRIVILDPQSRKMFTDTSTYFSSFSPPHTRFIALFRTRPRTAAQHENDAINFLARQLETCMVSSPGDDVQMKLGGRKRRKTKRRSVAKRTLRRVNRRRRIL
jgi:hypothetical protein